MNDHAIIFDMDGVLIDSENIWKKVLVDVFSELGLEYGITQAGETMGMRIDEVVELWYTRQPWEGSSTQEVTKRILADVTELVRSEGRKLPGVDHALEVARKSGAKVAIASSSFMQVIEAVVESLSLGTFDALHSAEHDDKGKPAPDVYLRTAEALGVDPHLCVVIEDSPNGLRSAKAAGMRCIAVPDPRYVTREQMADADLIINSLEELSTEQMLTLLAP